MANTTWTKPFYGVQHATVNRRQITVCDHGDGFVVGVVFPHLGAPSFFSSALEAQFSTVADAMAWAEANA